MPQIIVNWEAYTEQGKNPQTLQNFLAELIDSDATIISVVPTEQYQKVGTASIYTTKAVIVISN